jgi:hypothetical protein
VRNVHAFNGLRALAVALPGAFVGLGFAWLTRTRPPKEVVLENGWRVMHPMYVEPTPWWVYAALAAAGAVVALLAVRAAVSVRSALKQT